MRIFCELRSIFPSPAGARKNTSNEQNVRSYYMLNHRIRGLLFHYKQIVILQLASIFLGKSIQKHPDSVVENDVNKDQNVRGYYMSNHWTRGWLFYCKKIVFFGFYFLVRVSTTSWFCLCEWGKQHESQLNANCSFIRRYSPCCKPVKLGHYSVLRPHILRLLLTLYGKMTS